MKLLLVFMENYTGCFEDTGFFLPGSYYSRRHQSNYEKQKQNEAATKRREIKHRQQRTDSWQA